MRIALTSWTRPALLVGLLASATAVVVSRLAPIAPSIRVSRPETHIVISPHGVETGASGTLWLERDTGRTTVVPPFPGRTVQYASVSPWLDESGRAQFVGRFATRPGDPSDHVVGLVRATFPEGRVLDLVPTDVVPASRPCWYPGLRARVLFSGSDGMLYHHDFDAPSPRGESSAPAPRPIAWSCGTPYGVDVRISEPCWASDPRFERIIIVGLRIAHVGRIRPRYLNCRLWWLRLSEDGAAIEGSSPLFDAASLDDALEFRSPTVGRSPDGTPVLAYFSSLNALEWDLMVAPLSIDDAGRPSVAPGSPTRLAERCRPSFAPAFSGDGRWISAVQLDAQGHTSILRLDLTDPATPLPAVVTPAPASTLAMSGTAPVWKWSLLVTAIQALLGVDDWTGPRLAVEHHQGF